MAGKKTKEQIKAKKSKEAFPSNPSAAYKSTEFVGDSDDSVGAVAAPSHKRANSSGSKATAASISSKSAPLIKSTKPVKKSLLDTAKSSPSSSEAETEQNEDEDGSGSIESEEESSSADAGPIEAQANAASAKAAKTNLTSKTLYNVQPVNGVKRKSEEQSESKEDYEEEESESNDEEAGSIEEGSGSPSACEEDPTTQATKENAAAQTAQSRRRVNLYRPPAGFKTATISFLPSSEAADLLKPSNLEGKQIWHITAPAQVSIDSVKEVSTKSLKDGSSVLSDGVTDYGLVRQTEETNEALLLPSVRKNQYERSKKSVSSTLHLRQLVRLPNHVTRPNAPTNSAIESNLIRRQQPAGLKMRFHPFGVSSDSDSDGARQAKQPAPAPQFRHPPTSDKPSSSKKMKHKENVIEQSAEPSPAESRKSKPLLEGTVSVSESNGMDVDTPLPKPKSPEVLAKRKHDKSRSIKPAPGATIPKEANANADEMEIDPPPSKAEIPKKPSKLKHSKPNGTQPAAETTDGKETPEQRVKRKEEKRRQHEALAKQSSPTTDNNASSMHNPSKSVPTAPKMPLTEYSSRLDNAAQTKAVEETKSNTSQLLIPGQSSPNKDKNNKTEKAKRKEEKKRRREALVAED